MSRNNLSDNLPDDIFTSLQSLRDLELNISGCGLTTLPNRYVLYVYGGVGHNGHRGTKSWSNCERTYWLTELRFF